MRKFFRRVYCSDGFNMSVQAGSGSYCSPRVDNAVAYTAVEVGYPSKADAMLTEYADNPNTPTRTVYGWVPLRTVKRIIESHGGMVRGELPPG